ASRPTTTSSPAAKDRWDPSCRIVRTGGAGRGPSQRIVRGFCGGPGGPPWFFLFFFLADITCFYSPLDQPPPPLGQFHTRGGEVRQSCPDEPEVVPRIQGAVADGRTQRNHPAHWRRAPAAEQPEPRP